MLKHPFFRYSFFALLIIDTCYVLGLILVGASPVSWETLQAGTIWFVCFYWLPVWFAGSLILKLRSLWRQNTLAEWLISFASLTFGMFVTDQVLQLAYSDYCSMGGFVFFGGFIWSTPIYFVCRFIETNRKANSEKHARKEAQLATLRYQLNPHFMFNSLNTISAYIHTNPDLADDVLHELADILRYSLDTADAKVVSLQKEIDVINKYIAIEKARFGDRLNIEFVLPETIEGIELPPLILQPIVENAVKHNAKKISLNIVISITTNQGRLTVKVKDNGIGFPKEVLDKGFGQGIGMKNLHQRVAQLKDGKLSLDNDNGAIVTMEMRYGN
ncbi:sensor histidine kinase [Alteromonadaceae bacterium M269]|nr:sensor histidine kinase [Alteromonadaceae bacterium M269]